MRFLIRAIPAVVTYIICIELIYPSKVLAILFAVLVFLIMKRIYVKLETIKKEKETRKEADPAADQVDKVIEEGMEKLRRIRSKTRLVAKNDIAAKIQDICKVGVEIFEDIKKNPEDLRRAKPFTNYYLDATEKIVNQYVELSSKKDLTPEVEKSLEKVESVLDSVKDTYSKQLASLLEDDILDLNAEITVLEKTIKLEG